MNEETKDTRMLPVVAYRYTSGARIGGKWHYQESFPKWDDRKVSEVGQLEELCRLTDAQALITELRAEVDKWKSLAQGANAISEICLSSRERADRLAEKDARIAQLAAHARGKNKALANALKEIERLKKGIDYLRDNLEAAYEDRKELRAQLEQLQAAPAERGAVVLPERKDPDTYSRGSPDWHAAHAQNECLDEVASLNPAPATTDSDVREVNHD